MQTINMEKLKKNLSVDPLPEPIFQVIAVVRSGIVEIIRKPDNVEVLVLDFDNAQNNDGNPTLETYYEEMLIEPDDEEAVRHLQDFNALR